MCATLKKQFYSKKIQKNCKDIFLVGTLYCFKKDLRFFLTPKTWKNCPHNLPSTLKKQKSCTTKSPLMQDWVFRLGYLKSFWALIFTENRLLLAKKPTKSTATENWEQQHVCLLDFKAFPQLFRLVRYWKTWISSQQCNHIWQDFCKTLVFCLACVRLD